MPLFEKENQERIKAAIQEAEKKTSGEIRVCAEKHCPEEILDRAAWYFDQLNMQKTAARNGVLIYIAIADHQFAIIGDAGINAIVGNEFWDETRDTMIPYFKRGELTEGLIAGIEKAGLALAEHFPGTTTDRNELPDDIVLGDGTSENNNQ
ncbi:TLP18.3/Psb32/MOLO-1 phosphatase superfamily protein [Anseongella ginsenosidimutans]|uniref:TLP18.3/Psb32/MOLO-1 phosphatase superfamily protein n=1 Tax=Anseongella ginsenosidimutans TaxID=496056 RepID=A0A4R3L0L4_9SPHI|nr:TPM domain-containing protein [Anseongella ginsenosidimutans]QEC50906.1 TPM domain-containing protein [Anseongella ginsenosidimutans]QEC54099.1 TPM domain-containing protein [Anseongella ginsenosidimutans]TCS90460.1 TLP18.3/Psb32/MOLO-1 phosphatase superfamily protein [Anseongella ginsenosidimutans]